MKLQFFRNISKRSRRLRALRLPSDAKIASNTMLGHTKQTSLVSLKKRPRILCHNTLWDNDDEKRSNTFLYPSLHLRPPLHLVFQVFLIYYFAQ